MVTPNDRVGVVGANGTGKSSMLKVLAGIEGLDSGTISVQKGVTLGLPAAGGTVALRPLRLRRVHDGLRRPARDGGRAGDG